MSKDTRFLKEALACVLSLSLFALLVVAFEHDVGYEDTWILGGLVVPFLAYVAVGSSVLFLRDLSLRELTVVSTLLSVSWNVVPGLKYELLLGTSDNLNHYYLVYRLLESGRIPDSIYSGTPGMHLVIAVFCMILGISANYGMKFAVPLAYSVFPPMVYFISNRFLSNPAIKKCVVLVAALPLVNTYNLASTVFALPFLLSVFALPIMTVVIAPPSEKRRYMVLCVLLLVGLLVSHTVTPLLFLGFLFGLIVFLLFLRRLRGSTDMLLELLTSNFSRLLLISSVMFFAWWMFEARFLFKTMIDMIYQAFVGEFGKTPVPSRLFELNLLGKIQIFVTYHIRDLLLAIMVSMGILAFLKERRNVSREWYLYLCSIGFLVLIALLVTVELVTGYGDLEYTRLINYSLVLSPFLAGLGLSKLGSVIRGRFRDPRRARILMSVLVFTIISLSVLQFYPCQPLVPTGTALGMSNDDFVAYLHQVNTDYQKKMIYFVSGHCPAGAWVATDRATNIQIGGFGYESSWPKTCGILNPGHEGPLSPSFRREWNLMLLHETWAGPFMEPVEFRTADRLESARNHPGWNTLYDNGGSFIMGTGSLANV